MTIDEYERPDYYNQDGDPRMAPDYCPNADPEGAECSNCFWYDGDLDQCRHYWAKERRLTMTIDEAIKRLSSKDLLFWQSAREDDHKATKLGIEALKGIKAVRQLHPELSGFPLPGETKD